MLIANARRKKQIECFIDEDRKSMEEFYELMERDITSKQRLKEMQRLMAEDEDYYDPYLIAAEIRFCEGKNKEGGKILGEVYERAVMRIADSEGRWPKKMPWGVLENRHVMRALEQYGLLCWEMGNTDEALDIFRRLLRVNPHDNQGARYNILAIKLDLREDEWEKPFEVIDDGEVIGLGAFKMHRWFCENVEKFPDEFQWWLDYQEAREPSEACA